MKRISGTNLGPSEHVGDGFLATSSTVSSRVHMPNGGSSERRHSYLSNDFSFPPGGFPSLRLPMVGVLSLVCDDSSCIAMNIIQFMHKLTCIKRWRE